MKTLQKIVVIGLAAVALFASACTSVVHPYVAPRNHIIIGTAPVEVIDPYLYPYGDYGYGYPYYGRNFYRHGYYHRRGYYDRSYHGGYHHW